MKKCLILFGLCFLIFFTTACTHTQTGYTTPQGSTEYGVAGQWYGFTGQSQTVPVNRARRLAHKTPVVVAGNLVLAIGGDRYVFKDSSGEITVKIGHREWQYFGSTIAPSDFIEISGEVHRSRQIWNRRIEIHARFIRKI